NIPNVGNTVVWYAADDKDCPPSHGKWLAEQCLSAGPSRVLEGYGHMGGDMLDMPQFWQEMLRVAK
ncbi:hypothetical protein KIPB_009064, partial [Kipferlia bialata]